jgi:hypothetical protein
MANSDGTTNPTNGSPKEWKQVTNKKPSASRLAKEKLESMRSAMKQTKVTVIIRIPKDNSAEFSVADVHSATVRELSKQDSNLVVLDSKGVNHINIYKELSTEKYKEVFQPREKSFANGTAQVSIAHYILSETESFNKALLLPFLKKNGVFIYFNQKEGLEHFTAIGVLFGPHPELAWRQSYVEKIEKTMKADITPDECKEINTNHSNPKIVISMVPQQISNPRHSKTTSLALEIRVPAAHERTYLNILERLNERKSTLEDGEADITLDDRLGIFFPYHAKRSRPKLFDSLMIKQNSEMNSVSAIPLFGITTNVLEYEIVDKQGNKASVHNWIFDHPNIISMETTASTTDLGKYMLVVDRECKDIVEDYIDELLRQIPELEENSTPFKHPQRGGNAYKNREVNIENYLNKLEEKINEELSYYEEEDLSTSPPPPRPKRLTISYAQAMKRLSFGEKQSPDQSNSNNSNVTMNTTMSTLTQSTLDEALEKIRKETEKSLERLRTEMQEKIQSMENSIATAVINAIRSTPEVVHAMETEESEAQSLQSSAQETTVTMKTITEQFEALTNVVQLLSERVSELSKNQQENQNKRNRPNDLPPRQLSQSLNSNNRSNNNTQSPPTKQHRSSVPTPPKTPPPNGNPATAGSREGN